MNHKINQFYFDDKTSVSDILKQNKKLVQKDDKCTKDHTLLTDYNNIINIKTQISNHDNLNKDEKNILFDLLDKEFNGNKMEEDNIFKERFLFYFATLDYISRKTTSSFF